MADPKQALEDLALLVQLCDRLAAEGEGSMYHADTLAMRNGVVRRLREFIERTAGVPACPELPAVEGDARQQFETWMRRKHPQRSLERTNYPGDHGDGDYVDGRTHEKWHTWQEAYRHALWFAAGRGASGVLGTSNAEGSGE